MHTVPTCLAALLLATSAHAQQASPACKVPPPQLPQLEWKGETAYNAKAQVKDGRVVAIEITALKGAVERRSQRAIVMAIDQALRRATCQPGDYEFQQRFDFDLR